MGNEYITYFSESAYDNKLSKENSAKKASISALKFSNISLWFHDKKIKKIETKIAALNEVRGNIQSEIKDIATNEYNIPALLEKMDGLDMVINRDLKKLDYHKAKYSEIKTKPDLKKIMKSAFFRDAGKDDNKDITGLSDLAKLAQEAMEQQAGLTSQEEAIMPNIEVDDYETQTGEENQPIDMQQLEEAYRLGVADRPTAINEENTDETQTFDTPEPTSNDTEINDSELRSLRAEIEEMKQEAQSVDQNLMEASKSKNEALEAKTNAEKALQAAKEEAARLRNEALTKLAAEKALWEKKVLESKAKLGEEMQAANDLENEALKLKKEAADEQRNIEKYSTLTSSENIYEEAERKR